MSLQTLVLIILWALALILFGSVVFVTFLLGRHTVRNNPKRAYIFVKNGSNVESPHLGILDEKCKRGVYYGYGKNKVMVPSSYEEVYYRNRRLIFINHIGKLIAIPFDKDESLDKEASENLIYELCASHIGADSIRALKGTKTANVIIIAIIAFVLGAIIVFGFTQYQKATIQPQSIIEIPKPTQPLIEVK